MAPSASTMIHRGYVSSEGGPLLVLDEGLRNHWRGIEDAAGDYVRACAVFDADPAVEGGMIEIGPGRGLLWEMAGAGTADIFQDCDGRYVVSRPWLHADEPDAQARAAARLACLPAEGVTDLGILETPSDHALILWATENAARITSLHGPREGRPKGDLAMLDSALALRTGARRYRAFHDTVASADGSARRLHMSALRAQPSCPDAGST